MPSRICKFLADMTAEERAKYLASAPNYITHEGVLDILKRFDVNNPKKNSRMANQFTPFLQVPGLQLQVTHWITSDK